jgi:outer membrane autotransporter protein
MWLRTSGSWIDGDATVDVLGMSHAVSYDTTQWVVQGGVDFGLYEGAAGRVVGSVFGQWGRSDTEVMRPDGGRAGTIDVDGYGGGASATWYGENGLYVDLLAMVNVYSPDIAADLLGTISSTDSWGLGTSIEAGYALEIASGVRIVPQGQLIWQRLWLDDHTDDLRTLVDWESGHNLEGRLGVAIEAGGFATSGGGFFGYADVNVVHEFVDPGSISLHGVELSHNIDQTSVEFGGGVNLVGATAAGSFAVYLDGDYRVPIDGGGATVAQGTGGIRTNW